VLIAITFSACTNATLAIGFPLVAFDTADPYDISELEMLQ
jgi:hypothetical protein